MPSRRQASLYLNGMPGIEELRRRFNPTQAKLIPAHVTLCREDEVRDWGAFEQRLLKLLPLELVIEFGSPIREGDFVYLPAIGSTESFDELRRKLLTAEGGDPRKHSPHVTIIHPRNGQCTDAVFRQIVDSLTPFAAIFREVSLIEQRDGGPWLRFAEA